MIGAGGLPMKIANFSHQGVARLGVVDGDSVVDLKLAAPDLPGDLVALINMGNAGFDKVRAAVKAAKPEHRRALSGLALRPPIPRPGKIICLGLNYAEHAAEGGHQKPTYPSFFMRGATSLIGHGEPIVRPRVSDKLDYEAELVAVVGKKARHVRKERSLDYIA